MAFVQNNNYGVNNNNGGGEKKKTNFRVGKVYGIDGIIDVSVWNSDKGGVYTIMSIKAAVGKDPSTGGNVYEQKMSGELPSIFMNADILRAIIEGVKGCKDYGTINASIDTKRGSKMSIVGNGNQIKITIDNQKTGTRTCTLESLQVGTSTIHSSFLNLMSLLDICFKKAIRNKLDPEEFAMALSGEGGSSDEGESTEIPF
jgi:hypothetical protein